MAAWKPQMNESAEQTDEKGAVVFLGCESMKESCRVSRRADRPVGTSKVALSFAVGDTMSSFQERSEGAKAEVQRITTEVFMSESAPPSPQVHQHSPIRCHLMNANAKLHLQSRLLCRYFTNYRDETGSRQTKRILKVFSVIHHCRAPTGALKREIHKIYMCKAQIPDLLQKMSHTKMESFLKCHQLT